MCVYLYVCHARRCACVGACVSWWMCLTCREGSPADQSRHVPERSAPTAGPTRRRVITTAPSGSGPPPPMPCPHGTDSLELAKFQAQPVYMHPTILIRRARARTYPPGSPVHAMPVDFASRRHPLYLSRTCPAPLRYVRGCPCPPQPCPPLDSQVCRVHTPAACTPPYHAKHAV